MQNCIWKRQRLLLMLTAVLWASAVRAQSPVLQELRLFPPDVQLTTARDLQSLVVQAVYADGVTRDVTPEAQLQWSGDPCVDVKGGVLHPTGDGAGQVTASFGGLSVAAPVRVARSQEDPPISFQLDVMPVFMKAGCNTGSCHGAARGKDGFRLSLFGFDPQGDYYRLTRELSGRRVNLALPESSLLLEKAGGLVPHTGGKRIEPDSALHDALLRWLTAGALNDSGEVPRVTKVELFPPDAVLQGEGATQQMTVRAFYSDDTDRDVTGLAYFMTNNDNSAAIDQRGVVTAANRGEAFIMARFETHTVGSHVIVLPRETDFASSNPQPFNYIDEHIHAKLLKLRINPSEVCSDEEFLRRVTLDICGSLPTVQEYNEFIADQDPQKRARRIDSLLERKEFVELWVMKWAELLTIHSTQQVSYKSTLLYFNWLQEQIASNVPVDRMVQELLGSSGGTFANPATNYYQNETDTLKLSENVAQVFMGMRIQCAQCHNHPFDRWTMDDYYAFAAFFSQIGRKQGEDPREIVVFNAGGGDINHPIGGRVMAPKFLGGDVPDVAGKDRREVLAKWLASSDNPYFARNLANIVWAHFFGKGIINEADDVRVSNPPVNAALLDALAAKITQYNYDFKQIVRDICNSRTYQLSTATNPSNEKDARNFSHAELRRLRAEVLLDVISQATGTKNKFAGLPLGARAVQIADGNTSTYFLTTFGRASRETVCSCEVKMEPNLSQALHLLNGDTLQTKIREGRIVEQALADQRSPEDILQELYIRALCRPATDQERQQLLEIVNQEKDPRQALEDLFWALLNSREFVFNH